MTLRTVLPLAALALASTATLPQELGLPHTLAPSELPLIRPYRDSRAAASRGITTPPPFAVRTMAEWEEVQSVVVTWTSYSGILKQIVRAARTECEVIIVCDNAATVQAYLQNNSYGGPLEDLSNIVYLEEDFNSVWVRDFGPESIYANEVDSLLLLDWIYNRPRPADDALSDALGAYKGVAVYSTTQAPNDLVHTGGNFMSDGFGTAFSSELVLEENGPNGEFNQTVRNEAGVDAMMGSFMGIQPGRYVKMQRLLYDNINHIDMHMKLLDEETLLVGEFPLGLSDGPRIEANVQDILDNVPSVFDDQYNTVRVPMPPSTGGNFPPNASYRTYANNVFINGTVLVPTYRTEYDSTGLRILRESLPGYNVVGIDCDNSDQNIISASGAIHCITKTIGVADPTADPPPTLVRYLQHHGALRGGGLHPPPQRHCIRTGVLDRGHARRIHGRAHGRTRERRVGGADPCTGGRHCGVLLHRGHVQQRQGAGASAGGPRGLVALHCAGPFHRGGWRSQ